MYCKVLSDDNHFRKVEVRDSLITVIVTFDKLSETFEVHTIVAKDGYESIEVINPDIRLYGLTPNAVFSNQDLSGGFSWREDTSIKFWTIRIPENGKMTYGNSSNKEDLMDFSKEVNALCGHQYALRAAAGGALFSAVVHLLLAPEPLWTKVAAVVLAAGLTLALLPIGYLIFNSQHECRRFFSRVTVVSGPRPYGGSEWIQD